MSQAQIILAIIGLLTAIASGAWISKKVSKRRNTKTTQSNINVSGEKNKVIGGDDNSESR